MASPQTEPGLTECAVCNDLFAVPKLLPCSHILCRGCLVTWLEGHPQSGCPLCRCAIVDPIKHKGRSVEEVADGFPTDLAMTAIVEAELQLSKQYKCRVCVNKPAVGLCLQCKDWFCKRCCKVHKKQLATKMHEVELLNSLTAEKLAAYHPATCPNHKDRVSETYCPNHDTSFCGLCASTLHRSCSEFMMSLDTKIDKLAAELSQLDDKFTEAVSHSDDVIHMLDKHIQDLERDSQAVLSDVKGDCDRLKAAIDARFQSVETKTLACVSEIIKKAQYFQAEVIQRRNKTITQKEKAALYKQFTVHKDFKHMVTMAKDRYKEIGKISDFPDNLQLNHKLIMSINAHIVTDIERNISRLGNIKMKEVIPASPTPDQDTNLNTWRNFPGNISKFDPMTATPSKGAVIEVRSKEDTSLPSITSVVTSLSAEELYVADYPNKSIKVCSLKSRQLISILSLDVQPDGMTLVNDNLLAATTTECCVLLIDITNKGSPTLQNKIATARQYRGITVDRSGSDDPMLVVSCGHDCDGPASVDILTLTGAHVGTLVSPQNMVGLTYPWYLHADTQRDVLHISDYGRDCLFCVKLSTGRLLSQLKHEKLTGPNQVCTDSAGNVFVASDGGRCVLVRSAFDGWRVLVTGAEHGDVDDDIPCGACINNSSLIVSWWSGVVKRYRFI